MAHIIGRHPWHKCHPIRHIRLSDKLNSEFLNRATIALVGSVVLIYTRGQEHNMYYGERCYYMGISDLDKSNMFPCTWCREYFIRKKLQEMEIIFQESDTINMVEKTVDIIHIVEKMYIR